MNCFNFSVGAEALWWKPCLEPYYYGQIEMDGGRFLEQLPLCPDYKWGWRIFANLSDRENCRMVDGEWAHVKGKESKTKRNIEGLQAFSFSNEPAEAVDSLKAVIDFQYDKAGGKAGLKLYGSECTYFYGYLGGRWVRIELEQKSILEEGGLIADSYTLYHGGAFEAGIGGRAKILCDFGASFRLGLLAPIVYRKHSLTFTEDGVFVAEFHYSDPLCCKGGFEFRGGVNFIAFRRCGWVKVEVGYELDYYFKALLREQPVEVAEQNVVAENFGIGGPYVGVTVGF